LGDYLLRVTLAVFSGCDGALFTPSVWLGNCRKYDGSSSL